MSAALDAEALRQHTGPTRRLRDADVGDAAHERDLVTHRTSSVGTDLPVADAATATNGRLPWQRADRERSGHLTSERARVRAW